MFNNSVCAPLALGEGRVLTSNENKAQYLAFITKMHDALNSMPQSMCIGARDTTLFGNSLCTAVLVHVYSIRLSNRLPLCMAETPYGMSSPSTCTPSFSGTA